MTNKELLDGIIDDRVDELGKYDIGSEPHGKAHKELMECFDRAIEFEKIEDRRKELELKELEVNHRIEHDKREVKLKENDLTLREKEYEYKKKSDKGMKIIKYFEIGIPLVSLVIIVLDEHCKMNKVFTFEEKGMINSSPGREWLKGLFKKKH